MYVFVGLFPLDFNKFTLIHKFNQPSAIFNPSSSSTFASTLCCSTHNTTNNFFFVFLFTQKTLKLNLFIYSFMFKKSHSFFTFVALNTNISVINLKSINYCYNYIFLIIFLYFFIQKFITF